MATAHSSVAEPLLPPTAARRGTLRRMRPLAAVAVPAMGVLLGFAVPAVAPTEYFCPDWAHQASMILGWTYFLAWSVSFYPQAVLNWERRSVVGLSLDFTALNVVGFACYSVFNVGMYFWPAVREQYAQRHDGSTAPLLRS